MELQVIQNKIYDIRGQVWTELVAICDKLQGKIKHTPVTPFAFSQEGVAMLSGVLRSQVAVQVNINIMRAFVLLRQYALGYAELNQKLEKFMIETNMQFCEIYQILMEFAEQKKELEKPRNPIGFIKKRERMS